VPKEEKGTTFKQRIFDRLSYFEISVIGSFFSYRQVLSLRRLSKNCNIGLCFAILRNLDDLRVSTDQAEFDKTQQYIKDRIPPNEKYIINFRIITQQKDWKSIENIDSKKEAAREIFHLMMRLIKPERKDAKFDFQTIRTVLGYSNGASNAHDKMNNIDYTKVKTAIYKEVLRRYSLWEVETRCRTLSNKVTFENIVKFIDNSLKFLAIKEDEELFAKMNSFMSIQDKNIYVMALAPKKQLFENHI